MEKQPVIFLKNLRVYDIYICVLQSLKQWQVQETNNNLYSTWFYNIFHKPDYFPVLAAFLSVVTQTKLSVEILGWSKMNMFLSHCPNSDHCFFRMLISSTK